MNLIFPFPANSRPASLSGEGMGLDSSETVNVVGIKAYKSTCSQRKELGEELGTARSCSPTSSASRRLFGAMSSNPNWSSSQTKGKRKTFMFLWG